MSRPNRMHEHAQKAQVLNQLQYWLNVLAEQEWGPGEGEWHYKWNELKHIENTLKYIAQHNKKEG